MGVSKKHIVIGVAIGAATLAVIGVAYIQYQRLMDYVIKFKGVKLLKISKQLIDFELFISLQNKSDMAFDITKQAYDVYINNKLVAKIGNKSTTHINKGENTVPLRIRFSPDKISKDAGGAQGLLSLLISQSQTRLKVDIRLYAKLFGFIPVPISYVYETTLKELMSDSK